MKLLKKKKKKCRIKMKMVQSVALPNEGLFSVFISGLIGWVHASRYFLSSFYCCATSVIILVHFRVYFTAFAFAYSSEQFYFKVVSSQKGSFTDNPRNILYPLRALSWTYCCILRITWRIFLTLFKRSLCSLYITLTPSCQ